MQEIERMQIIIIIIKSFSKNVSKAASSSQDNVEWWNKLRVQKYY